MTFAERVSTMDMTAALKFAGFAETSVLKAPSDAKKNAWNPFSTLTMAPPRKSWISHSVIMSMPTPIPALSAE
jgi:hypothetical protein